jgi:hypothetical protein
MKKIVSLNKFNKLNNSWRRSAPSQISLLLRLRNLSVAKIEMTIIGKIKEANQDLEEAEIDGHKIPIKAITRPVTSSNRPSRVGVIMIMIRFEEPQEVTHHLEEAAIEEAVIMTDKKGETTKTTLEGSIAVIVIITVTIDLVQDQTILAVITRNLPREDIIITTKGIEVIVIWRIMIRERTNIVASIIGMIAERRIIIGIEEEGNKRAVIDRDLDLHKEEMKDRGIQLCRGIRLRDLEKG